MTLLLPPLSKPHHHHNLHFHCHQSRFKTHAVQLQTTSISSDSSTRNKTGVIIIGAGLAGLAAANRLNSANIPFVILEASDGVGGRVRTDVHDGFILDRGFQIFITAYPEAQKVLDYKALDLKRFYSGASVFFNGGFHTVADTLRHFPDSLGSLMNPIGSVFDKLLIGLTRLKVLNRSDEDIISAEEVPIMTLLRKSGFSDSIIDRFFRPFFGGIFFDRELETTSRLFDFIFKCLALGDNALPAKGIATIPEQLAQKLPLNSMLFNSKVVSIDFDESNPPKVRLHSGEVFESELGVIVAVEEPEAKKLLPGNDGVHEKPGRSTACLYFSTDRAPVCEPILFLNGSGSGIVNNMFFPTNVAPSYGPPGKTLVSVSVIGSCEDVLDEDLTAEVVRELSGWFGESTVRSWRHLRTYRIRFAQPDQCPPTELLKDPKVRDGLYVCGDHWSSATFDGALVSGRKAAEALIKDRALVPSA